MNTWLILPAAGAGVRLGHETPKALVPLAGRPMVFQTLQRLQAMKLFTGAVVLAPPGYEKVFLESLSELTEIEICVLAGGAARQDSVGIGLDALGPDVELVAVHDAARPFVGEETMRSAVENAREHGASTVALPCADTVLEVNEAGFLNATPDRERLWLCQTPQVFRTEIIRHAHDRAREEKRRYTDDATLVRAQGHPVRIVEGTAMNFKITTPSDLAFAEYVLEKSLV